MIYNIYFHPLANFPGPTKRAASTFVDQWTKCIGRQLPDEYALHEKYGPVVRMSPNALSFVNPQAWKDIYTHKAGKRQLQKDPKFYGIDGFGGGIPDDARHAREKRLLLRGFSDAALHEQEPLYAPYFDLFVKRLYEEIDGPHNGLVDMHEWFSFVAFDIVGELIFGQSFGCLETGETHYFIHNIYRSIQFATVQQMAMRYRWLGYLIKLMYWLVPSFTMARKRHHAFTIDRVDKRLANNEGRKDIMSHVRVPSPSKGARLLFSMKADACLTQIHQPKDEVGLTRNEIIGQCNTIVIAGSETITTLLSGCLYFLMKNTRVYDKLKAEVRGAFKADSDMNMATTARLPYLTAVLEESLRCYPPVPNRNPRRTGPNGDMIDGHFVPPDVSLIQLEVRIWKLQTDCLHKIECCCCCGVYRQSF